MRGASSLARRAAADAAEGRPPERPHSFVARLAAAYAVIGLGALVVGGVILHQTLNRVVWMEHQRGILAAGAEVTNRIEREGPAGLARPLGGESGRRFDAATGSMLFAVTDSEGNRLAVSPGVDRQLPRVQENGQIPPSFQQGQDGTRLWGVTRWVTGPDGRRMAVQIAQDMERSYIVLDDVPAAALGPVILVLVIGGVLLFVANVGLLILLSSPLRRAAREAERIGHGGPPRLDEQGIPQELLPLIGAVNGALDRLDDSLEWQRGFSAEVAHELRTPLAIIQAELDLLDAGAVTDRLRRDVQELAELVSDLLEAAEAARDMPVADGAFDLAELVAHVARRFTPIAAKEGHALDSPPANAPVWVRGEREAIGRALRNLVENAIAHSPPAGTVTLRLAAPRDGMAVVEVADQGKGVPEAERKNVFRRHWRAGDVRRRGLGLGLSIVERIVSSHGGIAEVGDAPGGGALFALHLPLAPAAALAVAKD
ncbi:sensor histidine kinase [Pararoseomonas indoligenes]|uniref:histidine kinase n=1 Tax=Roseomonas indoligenes TaxID=2820811 RepID=A0A940MWC1_9PROT|nr:HAMP domain-containing sensor histidine kinase [Pararoseomonas indoligenes]MBP0493251.1 HAMP domain-containing histidine kinase [Pararoseomonas indoligenes]